MIMWIIMILIVVFFVNRLIPVKGITNISVQEAKDRSKDKHVQFIDVRTPGEFNGFHSKPFKNIPLSNLQNKMDTLDKDKDVVVICQSGMRSAKAAKMLKKQGFNKIYNVKGGMSAWR
ncbi:Rhodanese-related sulfurtransferase [Terribacillus halophilus]|uniref:Rhodanese-related sulfurtransferase n=1 Tax=Terribacillus halophilus TaxID=361279 RepID=A0A1G6MQP5_9BACI|nr:rhodanese-like domain-containing protein [Terribacillus halophilus]SDC57908.1 Rhodanese-related sulfurtransferase [Terribacillus halophilus]